MIQAIIIESDSLLAIREIDNGHESFNEWFNIILDIIQLAQQYASKRFCHISRIANEYAHLLVEIPSYLGDYKVWRNSLPHSFCNPDMS